MDKVNDVSNLILQRLAAIEDALKEGGIATVQEDDREKNQKQNEEEAERKPLEFLASIGNVGISIVAISYAIGFLVVNSYLSQYGTYTMSLIQSQYLAAGILILIMLFVAFAPEIIFTVMGRNLRIRIFWWRTTVFVTSVTCICVVLLFMLSDLKWLNVLTAFIPFLILLVGSDIFMRFHLGWAWGRLRKTDGNVFFEPVVQVEPVRSGLGVGFLTVVGLLTMLGFLYLFPVMTYPLIKPEFGGNAPQLAQFYGSTSSFEELRYYGIPLTTTISADTVLAQSVMKRTYTIPLYLLGETPTSYIVTDVRREPDLDMLLPRERFGVSFQIPKKDVSGVLFLSRTQTLSPVIAFGYGIAIFLVLVAIIRLSGRIIWPILVKLANSNQD